MIEKFISKASSSKALDPAAFVKESVSESFMPKYDWETQRNTCTYGTMKCTFSAQQGFQEQWESD